ncbi:nitroreductase [Paraburkholderia sp. JPY432]|uniref:nitroreductase n=1 Tax=Paraburkholderia youngii TaxID=2782701 RepID=UPI001594F4BE|nr:nitroreductase [Paraburkholderia youngii]NVH75753.1 nitroreductase [Paraburkholderia youngii]
MDTLNVIEALRSRRSVRGFLDTPVSRATVESILTSASFSPSAANTQPWRVYACSGEAKQQLRDELVELHYAGGGGHVADYQYYPEDWQDPYLSRRKLVGKQLYEILGIARTDTRGMYGQYAKNFGFFGAPVGLFFTLDRIHRQAAWIDLGMFMQSVMLAAAAHGLQTCPQQAFARYHRVIRRHLHVPESEIVVCGMALGYEDPDDPANTLRTGREAVDDFTSYVDL